MRRQRILVATVCTCIIISAVFSAAELTIERTSGVDPDRFSVHVGCKQDSCSVEYGASTLVKDTCSCSCTKEKPTFSLQYSTCVRSLPGCEDIYVASGLDEELIFTFLVSSYQLKPLIPELQQKSPFGYLIVVRLHSDKLLKDALSCPLEQIDVALAWEEESGFITLKSLVLELVQGDLPGEAYIQINQVESNATLVQLTGKLFKVTLTCEGRSLCLYIKTNGNQKVKATEMDTTAAPTSQALTKIDPKTAFILGGSIVGVLVLAFIVVAAIFIYKKPKSTPKMMTIDRMKHLSSIKSSNKHPMQRVYRHASLGDLQPESRTEKSNKRKRNSFSSLASADSGRGRSNSPSTTPPKELVKEAYADALQEFSVATSSHHEFVQQPPTLFKAHAQKLTTVQQGISNVPGERVISPQPHRKSKGGLSALRRLFSRKPDLSDNEMNGSRMSIDYNQFTITQVPQTKRFSEGHVNPDVSFNEEGKLPQNVELELTLAAPAADGGTNSIEYVDNYLYEAESDFPYKYRNLSKGDSDSIPTTNIDDVDLASEFDVYEHVPAQIEDFHV